MAKKPITGKSKLLSEASDGREPQEALHLKFPKKKKPTLKNYRLSEPDLQSLRKIVVAVNQLSPYKEISETSVIKALISIGSRLHPDKILRAVKEIK